jgi:hypothetical protein
VVAGCRGKYALVVAAGAKGSSRPANRYRRDGMNSPDNTIVARVDRMLHRKTTTWTQIKGGYTPAERWLARGNSSAVFVKCGVTPHTADLLRWRKIKRFSKPAFLWFFRAFDLSPIQSRCRYQTGIGPQGDGEPRPLLSTSIARQNGNFVFPHGQDKFDPAC